MRNNEDRIGAKKGTDASAAVQTANSGPAPLDFVRPVTVLELPSGGKYYPESHPLHGKDTIEIRQMTTAEEDVLTNRTLLKKGTAIDKFLERIMIDNPVGPSDLLVCDKNAVLIQSRIDGYGPSYKTKVTCPSCQSVQKKEFNLHQCLHTTESDLQEEGCTLTDNGTAVVSTSNGWQVEIRPLTGRDETLISSDEGKDMIRKQLTSMIVSVSGHTDGATITKAVEHLSGLDSRKIRKAYAQAFPSTSLRSEFECRSCGASTDMEVPLNADFFWAEL